MTRSFPRFVSDLEAALARPLPSAAAHAILAPQPRRQWPANFDEAAIRRAAALVLVFPIADRPYTVLTVRPDWLGRHGGQVSLPGGVIEPGETFERTALREAHEEIGLAVDGVRVLGRLTPIDIPVSGFRLYPVVGALDQRPGLKPADQEVARILEVPVDQLMAPETLVSFERERDGVVIVAPSFSVGTDRIWGATAMVLAEFLTLLGWSPQDPR